MKFAIIHSEIDAADPQGRTIRKVNLAKPLGALVEILPYEDSDHDGVRLFVVSHGRDCDGTPLYSLSWSRGVDLSSIYTHVLCGFSDDNLKVVQ